MKRSEILFAALLVPLDFLAVIGSFSLAYWLRTFTDLIPGVQLPIGYIPPFAEYASFLWKAGLLFIVIGVSENLYVIQNRSHFLRELPKVFMTALVWLMAVLAWFFLRRAFFFSRLVLIYGFAFSVVSLICWRVLLKLAQQLLFHWGIGKTRVLILGANKLTEHIYQGLRVNPAYKIIGCLHHGDNGSGVGVAAVAGAMSGGSALTCPIVGHADEAEAVIAKYHVEEVIQTQSHASPQRLQAIIDHCQERHLSYRFLPDLLELHNLNVNVQTVAGLPVIELRRTPLEGWGRVGKRLVDLLGAGLGLLILSPVFLLLAALVKLTSRGPVFFRQTRISQGQPFTIYKFRSMVVDAEELKTKLAAHNERQGPLFKIKDDPRITRLGAFLRKWSLDELPQLWNVFRGQMSLVGPRPHLPTEIQNYAKHHRKVLALKAGITGMAQVSGRSDLIFEEEVRLDVFYIENWSLGLDFQLLLKTIWVVLFRPGKY